MTLEAALNEELVKVLGADHNWTAVIAGVTARRASAFARSRNGLLEDVVTDVTGDIIIQARDGKLAQAVIRAKEQSGTPAELVENLRHVVMKAAFYRVSDAMKWRYRGATQFSQMAAETDFSETVMARTESEVDLSGYSDLLVAELEVMATAADWKNRSRLSKRLRKAKAVVPDRVAGMALSELMELHDVKGKATMQAILDDIGQALARVAGRLGDPTLLYGTAGIEVA